MPETVRDPRQALYSDLHLTGFYPHLVTDLVQDELADASVISHLVHMETHVDRAEVHRHLTVMVLTPEELAILHIDDQGPEGGPGQANVSAETVALAKIDSVVVSSIYPQPDQYHPGDGPRELTLGVAWSGGARMDMYSADCPDPTCELDHGYTGQSVREDLLLRVSAAADGADRLKHVREFARRLRSATTLAAQPHTGESFPASGRNALRGFVRSARGDHR